MVYLWQWKKKNSKGAPIEGQDIITMETSLMGPMAGLEIPFSGQLLFLS